MKAKFRTNIVRGFIALAVALAILAALNSTEEFEDFRCSIHSKYRNGLMAIHKTLQDSDVQTVNWIEPISRDMPDGTLYVLSPRSKPDSREVEELKQWISKGNTLVYSGDSTFSLGSLTEDSEKKVTSVIAKPSLPNALTKGINALQFAPNPEQLPKRWNPDDIYEKSEDILNIMPPKKEKTDSINGLYVQPVFTSGSRALVGVVALGKGRVVLLASYSCMSNKYIGQASNADFLLNTLHPESQKNTSAIFYEYGNGYREMLPGEGLTSLISKPAKIGILIALIAFLIMLPFEMIRFGPVRILREKTRTRSEYLSSLSNLLKRGNGTDEVLAELGNKFIGDVAGALKVARPNDIELIVAAAQAKGFEECEKLRKMLESAAEEHDSISPEGTLRQAREWAKMRKEIRKLR